MFLLYAARTEKLSPLLIGVVFSASSIGGLLGGLVSKAVIKRFRLGLVYAYLDVGHFRRPAADPAGQRPAACPGRRLHPCRSSSATSASASPGVVMVSLRQTCTPRSLMGRMNAAFRTMLFGGGAFGGLCGGLIAGRWACGPASPWW